MNCGNQLELGTLNQRGLVNSCLQSMYYNRSLKPHTGIFWTTIAMIHRIASLIYGLLYTTCAFAQANTATPVTDITVQPGFKVELLRSAQEGEDSWISMSFDDKGNIILGLDTVGVGHLDMIANGDEIPFKSCLLYTSPSPRDRTRSRMPSSA